MLVHYRVILDLCDSNYFWRYDFLYKFNFEVIYMDRLKYHPFSLYFGFRVLHKPSKILRFSI